MKTNINYYVILTVCYDQKTDRIKNILPEMVKRPLFYPSDVEINPYGMESGKWINRKYCGELTPDQLCNFQREISFNETCKTMGALTLEYGILDAISFSSCDGYSEINAYIAPILTNENNLNERFDKLPNEQKDVVRNKIGKSLNSILNYLENEFQENNELPEYCREIDVDLYQLQLAI